MSPASRRRATLLALLLVALPPLAARAGNKADAFEGKIQPISGQLYQKAGRLEISPTLDLSLNDAFYRKTFVGAKIGWYFSEFFELAAIVSTGSASPSGSAVVCPANQGCQPASKAQLWQVPGRLRMVTGLEADWSPVYGKLNLAAEQVIHFDLYLLGGVDWFSYDTVLSATDAEALAAAGGSPGTSSSIGGHVGIGLRCWITTWMAVRLEVRDQIYAVAVPNAQTTADVQNQLFTGIGLSFFLPPASRPAGGAK
jgi:outer membrane beta-barrel protein